MEIIDCITFGKDYLCHNKENVTIRSIGLMTIIKQFHVSGM